MLTFFKKMLIFYFICMRVLAARKYICACLVPAEARKGYQISGNGATGIFEMTYEPQ